MLRDNFAANQPQEQTLVRSKEGILLRKEDEVKKRWKEYFAEVLNRPPRHGRNWRVKLVNHSKLKQVLLHVQRQLKNGKAWWCRWHDNGADESRP